MFIFYWLIESEEIIVVITQPVCIVNVTQNEV